MNGRRRLAWLPPDAPAPPPSIGARHDPCQHPGRSCGQGIRNGEPTSPGQANQATPFLGLRKRRRPEALWRQPQSGAPFTREPSAGAGLHVVPCVQAGPRGPAKEARPGTGRRREGRATGNGVRPKTAPGCANARPHCGAGAGPGEWRGGRGASGDAAAWRSAPPRVRGSSPRPRQAPDELGSCHHAPRNGIAGTGSDTGASSCPGGNWMVARLPRSQGSASSAPAAGEQDRTTQQANTAAGASRPIRGRRAYSEDSAAPASAWCAARL